MMPPELQRYLETCNPTVAQRIWDYIDGSPNAVDEIIAIVANRVGNQVATAPVYVDPGKSNRALKEALKQFNRNEATKANPFSCPIFHLEDLTIKEAKTIIELAESFN